MSESRESSTVRSAESETVRERLAPYLPYWPWVVVPLLVIVIAMQGARTSAQGRELALVKGDVQALEQQIAVLKRARSASPLAFNGVSAMPTPPARFGAARDARQQEEGAEVGGARARGFEPRGKVGKGKRGKRGEDLP